MADAPRPQREDPDETSFAKVLGYVLSFMGVMALLAFASIWLLRHC
jgi:hypothetical protein